MAGRRFWNVLGASKHFLNICAIAGNTGLSRTNGTPGGMDPETFALSKLILLWGTNTLTSGHHLWKFIQDARAAGAHVVAIDPIRTRTAEQADEHLPIRPGTDAALALGLMNVVLAEGMEDRDYLDNHTNGWENLRAEILRYPPERVAEITGLPEPRHPGPGCTAGAHPADRHPGHDGHPATRGRRHRDAHDRRHPRGDRRLAPSRRRDRLLHQRARPPEHRHPRATCWPNRSARSP